MGIDFFHQSILNISACTLMKHSTGLLIAVPYPKSSNVPMECYVKLDTTFQKMNSKLFIMPFFHPTLLTAVKFGDRSPPHLTKIFLNSKNGALRIISFANFRADSSPLYIDHKVLKLRDHITIQNCLFVHDSLKNISPKCFCAYFNLANTVHHFCTKSNSLGCLFVPKNSTFRYGIYSITNKCISNWNALSKALQLNLINISRSNLKNKLTRQLLDSYN